MRLLCEDLPAVRGAVKTVPEDFVVEEILAFEPSGAGEHVYLWAEKRGMTTQALVQAVARALGVPASSVGRAGQKDRQAVTRQYLSVPLDRDPEPLPQDESWRVLAATRHPRKLRVGRVRGNRFAIRLRGAGTDLAAAQAVLARLSETGVANYFGAQRFGRHGDNAEQGRALLAGGRAPGRFQRRVYLSALQSELFNDWLDRRIDDGLLAAAVEGDLLAVRTSGGVFRCDDVAVDSPRVAAGEVDPTGPMFGVRMRRPEGEARAREDAVLVAAGLALEDFARARRDAEGTRRPARVPLLSPSVRAESGDLLLELGLPRGAYATVVLTELTRSV